MPLAFSRPVPRPPTPTLSHLRPISQNAHASNANAGFPNHSEEYPPSCSPRDVRNDHSIRPEVDIGGLAVVCEVLDVDGLLVQDEDVSGHVVDLDLDLDVDLTIV